MVANAQAVQIVAPTTAKVTYVFHPVQAPAVLGSLRMDVIVP